MNKVVPTMLRGQLNTALLVSLQDKILKAIPLSATGGRAGVAMWAEHMGRKPMLPGERLMEESPCIVTKRHSL